MHQNDPILRSFFSISRDVNKVWRLHMNNFEWSKMQLQCNCRLPPKTCMHRIQCVLCSHCPYIAIWLQREHMRGFENFLEPSAVSTIVLKINQTSPHRMQSLQLLTCLCNCTFLNEWRINELLLLVLSNQCKACSVVHHNHTTTTQSQPQPQLHNHTLLCHHCYCIPVQLLYIQSEAKVSYPLSTKKIQKVKRNQQQEIRVTLSALWLVGRNIITQIQKYKNSPRCTFFVLSCFCRNS